MSEEHRDNLCGEMPRKSFQSFMSHKLTIITYCKYLEETTRYGIMSGVMELGLFNER